MSGWTYIVAGKEAERVAREHARLRGDVAGANVLVAGNYSGKTMREQEQESLPVQDALAKNLAGRQCRDATVFVEVGRTAGALLVLVEAATAGMLLQATRRVGAVVVVPGKVGDDVDARTSQDLDLLGQALWTYTLDGRLSWSLVTDGTTNMLQMTPTLAPRRQFGSRLYGE